MRPPLSGLTRLDVVPGTVAFVATMIGTVTFDGLGQGSFWAQVRQPLDDAFAATGAGADAVQWATDTVGLVACVALVAAFYVLGSRAAHRLAPAVSAERLRGALVHSLVPIALVYVAAHYLTFLLFEGQAIAYLLSDPLGRGWDLFGTASSAVDYGVLSQNGVWYAQVACVVAGHVAALTLAHDRALTLYEDEPRRRALAVRHAGDHGRIHDARAVAAGAGGHGVSAHRLAAALAAAVAMTVAAGCGAQDGAGSGEPRSSRLVDLRRSRRSSTRSTSTRRRRTSC